MDEQAEKAGQAEQAYSLDVVARRMIAQCRSEIAAALIQLEAGKDILRRSRALVSRWETQRSAEGMANAIRLPAFDEAKAGMFVLISPAGYQRVSRHRRARVTVPRAPADRHSLRRSASG
jgi:hypothetical protein